MAFLKVRIEWGPPSPSAPPPPLVCNFVVGDGFGAAAASETNTGSSYGSGLDCAVAVRNRYPLGATNGPGGVCWAEFGMHSSNPAWINWSACLFGGWPSSQPSPATFTLSRPPPISPSPPPPLVCNYFVGWSESASFEYLGNSFGSGLDCAVAVRTRYSLANGASYQPPAYHCYAVFGMDRTDTNNMINWRTSLFGGWPSPQPSPPPPSPSRPPPISPCLLYTSPSPRDRQKSRMPSSA